MEHWAGWLPVEASRPAWAAVTTLAQDYLRAGQADTLAQARADAMLDLILGQATATFVLHPTVPLEDLAVTGADLAEGAGRDDGDDLVPVSGYGTPGQSFIRRGHLRELAGLTGHGRRTRSTRQGEGSAARGATRVRVGECLALDPDTGATVGVVDPATGEVDPATGVLDPATDVVDPATGVVDPATGLVPPATDVVEDGAVAGVVDAGHVAPGSGRPAGSGSAFVRVPETDRYRPSAEVERMVKARDGRCRFPGCQVPVRFVDLDHVQAFDHDDPAVGGATSPWNLACLCRRHHRVKQLPGWRVQLFADGTMTWTDPSGVTRATWPEDHRPVPRPDRPPTPARAAPDPAPARRTEEDLAAAAAPDPAGARRTDEDLAAAAAPDPAVPPGPWPGSWQAERRAAELEPYSLLEDQFLDVLLAAGVELPTGMTAHRSLPRPPRRLPGGNLVTAPEHELDSADLLDGASTAGDTTAGDTTGGNPRDGEQTPARRIRPDRSHGQTPTRSIVLHPDTLAELDAMVARRTAPPF